eukprot:TRINITY_DN60530_c0_g1_i1.p1 TRINITY_DN60530_c0_g1~~TRINITY_DN60530_c0_g1_i1.p1  ORF type:complete len:825 (+),score=269.11 TRINITY_DN60530_c0_g1_i1:77-2551(+)
MPPRARSNSRSRAPPAQGTAAPAGRPPLPPDAVSPAVPARSCRAPGSAKWGGGCDYSVRVYLRVRPVSARELQHQRKDEPESVVRLKTPTTVTLLRPDAAGTGFCEEGLFNFDRVFEGSENSAESQGEVFTHIGPELIDGILCGFNVALMAYGQTASGKTYTMTGGDHFRCRQRRGVVPRLLDALFERMAAATHPDGDVHFHLEAGYFELYNEQLRDLCPGAGREAQRLQVREHPQKGPHAEGLTMHTVLQPAAVLRLLDRGGKERHVRSTKMNDVSSRSHAVLQLVLTQFVTEPDDSDDGRRTTAVVSKVNLVDLAGSERQKTSGAHGDALREMIHINTALHCLRKVIDSLTERRPPSAGVLRAMQRESALTWLLADSLGGNSKTALLATVSPAAACIEETLSTLRYASRARAIENKVRVNNEGQSSVVQALEEEIAKLQEQLHAEGSQAGPLRQRLRECERERAELAAQLEAASDVAAETSRARGELADRVDALQRQQNSLQAALADTEEHEHRLQAKLAEHRQRLRQQRDAELRAVQQQKNLAAELQELRMRSEAQQRYIEEMEQKYVERLETVARGDPRLEQAVAGALREADAVSAQAELMLQRVRFEAVLDLVGVMQKGLLDAYRENVRLTRACTAAVSHAADCENRILQYHDQTLIIRRLQEEMSKANLKEEKYLQQLTSLTLDHLMLRQRKAEEAQPAQLPQELRRACDFFGFDDPVEFSEWVIDTFGGPPGTTRTEGSTAAAPLTQTPAAPSLPLTSVRTQKTGFSTARSAQRSPGSAAPARAADASPAMLMSEGALSMRSSVMTMHPSARRSLTP